MAGNDQSTFSLLGSVSDAIFATAQEQGKKYGASATPSLIVGGDYLQGFADVATQIGAFPNIQNNIEQVAFNWAKSADTLQGNAQILEVGIGRDENRKSILREMVEYTDEFGQTQYKYQTIDSENYEKGLEQANVNISVESSIGFLTNSKGMADKAAAKYWESVQELRTLKRIAGVGDAFQQAVAAIAARQAGIDGDLTTYAAETRKIVKISGNQTVSDDQKRAILAQSIAMGAGFIDESARSAAAFAVESTLKGTPIDNLIVYTADNKVDAALSAARIKLSIGAAAATIANPVERAAFTAYITGARSDGLVGAAINGISDPKQIAAMTNIASTQLSQAYATSTNLSTQATGAAFDRYRNVVGVLDGKMTLGEQLGYFSDRFNGMKENSKALTVFGFLTGSSLKYLATYGGRYGASGQDTSKFLSKLGENTGDDMSFYQKTFVPFAKTLNPSKNTLGGFIGRTLTEKYDQRSGTYVADIKNLSVRNMGTTANAFLISGDANKLQKGLFVAYTWHPVQLIQGLVNGAFYQRYLWAQTGYGKGREYDYRDIATGIISRRRTMNMNETDAHGKNVYNGLSRFSYKFLNNKLFKGWLKVNRGFQYIIRAPTIIANKIIERTYYYAKRLANAVLKQLMKLLMRLLTKLLIGIAVKALLAAVTGGISILFNVINTLTGGFLEKVLVKLVMNIVMLGVVLVCGGIIICGAYLSEVLNPSSGSDIAQQYAPDPFFVPYGGLVPGSSIIPSITTIAPGTLPTIIPGSCPFDGGGPSLRCTQGPFGSASHMCSGRSGAEPAVDIVPPSIGVYAPEAGEIIAAGDYTCTDPTRPGSSIGGYFRFYGTQSGSIYIFYHAKALALPGTGAGTNIPTGSLIGVMTTSLPGGPNGCWSGAHVHMAVKGTTYVGSGYYYYVNALDVMKQRCYQYMVCGDDAPNMSSCAP